jgi:1-deoxy-D-xylulose-5-phosphate reductoisomerase
MKRRVVILGATGSVGRSALCVARALPDRIEVVGLSAYGNREGLAAASAEFPHARTVLSSGPDGLRRLEELAALPEADIVLIAIVGTAGLRPALAAIAAGKDLAIASKEILVMAGEVVMRGAHERGIHVLPVDSEHNAIFQCMEGHSTSEVRRVILTCSGGPFRTSAREEILQATPARALRHPTWSMGQKISIDSATLFNKGLEMIEARWLFDLPMSRVDVVVHPQSIIHSMLEFVDGSVLAQLSHSDMRFPIQYALTWPHRVPNALPPLDFAALGEMHFEEPRRDVFPALDLARRAGEACGVAPAVLNAANEVAVEAFLAGRIPFPRIWEIVAEVMEKIPAGARPDLEAILSADAEARQLAQAAVQSQPKS